VAEKITLVPEQIVLALAPIVTDGVAVAVTVIVMEFDVTLTGVAHDMDEVISTVTTSPFARAAF
jgi:hypothetical protein